MSATPLHLREHVETVAKLEQEFLARRTRAERLGDALGAFIGSLTFITIHLCWFATWIIVNTIGVAGISRFDAAPFPLLDSIVAIEAIFLASFIVMRQTRTSRRSDERDHLILQILLLTEKEITASLKLDREIAKKIGLEEEAKGSEIVQLSRQTSIDEIAKTLQEGIPTE